MPQTQLQLQQQQTQRLLVCSRASSGSSSSSSPQQPQGGGILGFFDRLPPRVQLGIMGGLLFIGMFVIPFLQPSFMYGDTSKTAQQQTITNVKEGEPKVYKLPCYVPGASELYDFLQENSMPKKLPDGRTESPGVLRIYLSSLIILALFYACSAVVGLILRSVSVILRAVGIAGPPKPKPQE